MHGNDLLQSPAFAGTGTSLAYLYWPLHHSGLYWQLPLMFAFALEEELPVLELRRLLELEAVVMGQDETCVPDVATQMFCGISTQLVPTMQSTLGIEDDEITSKTALLLLLGALLPLLLGAGQYGIPPTIAQVLCESSAQTSPTKQLTMLSSREPVALEELLALGELIMLELSALEE
jgi:hypothetical protein